MVKPEQKQRQYIKTLGKLMKMRQT